MRARAALISIIFLRKPSDVGLLILIRLGVVLDDACSRWRRGKCSFRVAGRKRVALILTKRTVRKRRAPKPAGRLAQHHAHVDLVQDNLGDRNAGAHHPPAQPGRGVFGFAGSGFTG